MFRTFLKITVYILLCIDILHSLTIDPKAALVEVVFVASVVWAWKLYPREV
jgi:hypothetical protein